MLITHYLENIPASSCTLTTLLWSYRVSLYSPDPLESPPATRPLAHISIVTEASHTIDSTKLSHFPDNMLWFHDHGASLTRTSSPSSRMSPTICAPVDPLVFSKSDNLWLQLLALTLKLGKAQSRHPREAVVHIARKRVSFYRLDIVAQDSALLRKRDVIQDLNTGLTHVLA